MTDDNSTPLVDMDDLDKFENAFFNREPEVKADPEPVEVDENETDPLAAEEDTDASAQIEDEDEDEVVEEQPQPKPKSKTQQRIEKLLERERLANERAVALENRLAALEARKTEEVKQPAPREQMPVNAPSPDAVDKDGNPIYDLGEFDPLFIRDLTQFTIDQKMEENRQLEAKRQYESQLQTEQHTLQATWAEKLNQAEAELPEIRENTAELVDSFRNLDPNYGEFLATTIMQLDNGPAVLNYLSQNIGEAQKIVASGPYAATLALGRIDARVAQPTDGEHRNISPKRVSEAPKPPEDRTRGRGGQYAVRADTDDLDAFAREFFKN